MGTRSEQARQAAPFLTVRQAAVAAVFVAGMGALMEMDDYAYYLMVGWIVLYGLVATRMAPKGEGRASPAFRVGAAVSVVVLVLAVYAGARLALESLGAPLPSALAGGVAGVLVLALFPLINRIGGRSGPAPR
ncbi:peptidoglycan/LPS O-acetylase OafA/YrhL [Lipingzhangella halophila]|uniref:Peptidoglycan/LPS O-acetylase OafA/YrhL n=1 Tax=Lipingzhangella halophila TaxID=1783352 RepID=A0A7W7RI56_9ACTN|nr:hypothetical protein [Lipingzhangella halophila]MBB4932404.1 peptidoglycan/LPS O-acetylase OafA/YrhL [Lipingzhangella halophila]